MLLRRFCINGDSYGLLVLGVFFVCGAFRVCQGTKCPNCDASLKSSRERCDQQDETDYYNMLVRFSLARQLLRYKQPTGQATAVHSSWAWTLALFDLDRVVEGEAEDREEVDFYPPFYSVQGERYQWLEREGASIETYHKSVLWVSLDDIPSVVVSGSLPPQ